MPLILWGKSVQQESFSASAPSVACLVQRLLLQRSAILAKLLSRQATNDCAGLQSISEKTVLVTFPCDDAHSAFITTVIEGVGIGSDFGSVVVLPVTGGMAAYRHQVLPLQMQPQHIPAPVHELIQP